jgi:UDP-N-acetylglucosamine--N-acetylmuramyl-(pentapeptide) pyrophosphoryl-undecaprenol N-acetylglucosamine transferase
VKILIAGGGTAGHVNPGIALASALEDDEVFFLGTDRGAEAQLVPAAGYPLERIEVRGFDRSRPWSIGATGLKAAGAVLAARRVIRRRAPDVVVGMGGYVSLPACLGAATSRVPVVLHEQNIVLGLAHRVSKGLARTIAVSYEATLDQVGRKGVHTGNPVVPEIGRLDLEAARRAGMNTFELDHGRSTLLVFGGSQGAARINRAAAGLATTWRDRADVQVVHITGRSDHSAIAEEVARSLGSGAPLIYRVLPYVEDMGTAYGVADLALCRGGASTLAELGAVGLPAIIVPYPYHRDRQQERQGRAVADAGAGMILDDAETSTERVASLVDGLFNRPEQLAQMRSAARSFGRPQAASALAAVVRQAAR